MVADGAGRDPASDAAGEAARDAAREVGGELRRLGELLATRDAPADALAHVAATLRDAAASLAGQPVQPRWYHRSELGTADRAASRAYHDELGPLRGIANPVAPPLRIEAAARPDGRAAVGARVTLGPLHEGPPGIAHGGWLAGARPFYLGNAMTLRQAAAPPFHPVDGCDSAATVSINFGRSGMFAWW